MPTKLVIFRRGFAASLVCFALLSASAPAGSNDRLDTALEKAIGAQVADALRVAQGEDTDPLLRDWVQRIGARVSAPSPRGDIRPEFNILGGDVTNALAAPGGHIFVTRGLLDGVDSEEELACVLGHETAHHAKRHAQQQIGGNGLALLFFSFLRGDDLRQVRLAATVLNVLRALGKSREMESQADEVGYSFTLTAGDDPRGFRHFFEGFELKRRSDLEEYFATHPSPGQRFKATRSRDEALSRADFARIADGYQSRGLLASARLARGGGDPLDLPPIALNVPGPLLGESQAIAKQADALRRDMDHNFPTRRAGTILQQLMLLNNQADLRWLYVAGRAYTVQARLENAAARTQQVARVSPSTYDALAGYEAGANQRDSLRGRDEVQAALDLARGAPTPIKRASQAVTTVLVDLNNRFLRTNNDQAWLRYSADEGLLRYAESELSRADERSGRAWRVLSYARIRRYQARLRELVPATDALTNGETESPHALWQDLTQRRLARTFPVSGDAGSDTIRAMLSVQLGQPPDALDATRDELQAKSETPQAVGWPDVLRARNGIPENVATALRLLVLDLEREQIARGRSPRSQR